MHAAGGSHGENGPGQGCLPASPSGSLALADHRGYSRSVAHQAYYSLIGRDHEWELMPLGIDQGIGAVVWSPLGWGRLTGRIRRGQPWPEGSRLHDTVSFAPPVDEERLYRVVDALAKENIRKLVLKVTRQERQRDTQAQARAKQDTKKATRAFNDFQKKRGR